MDENTQARIARVKQGDARLSAAIEANNKIEALPEELLKAWESMRALIEYYETEWMDDFHALEGTPDDRYGVLSEDGVWNEMGNFYHGMQELAEVATRIVTEYEQSGRGDEQSGQADEQSGQDSEPESAGETYAV